MKRTAVALTIAAMLLAAGAAGAQQELELFIEFDWSEQMQQEAFADGFCSAYESGIGSPAPSPPSYAHPSWIRVEAFGHNLPGMPEARGILERTAQGNPPGSQTIEAGEDPLMVGVKGPPSFHSPRIQQAYILGDTQPKARLLVVAEDTGQPVMKLVLHDVDIAYYGLTRPAQQHQFRPDLPVNLAVPPTTGGGLGGGPIIGGPEETVLLNCDRVQVVAW
ncbi:MAG: hypothetical protein ACQER1_12980 [Armatimonadota bacterium]